MASIPFVAAKCGETKEEKETWSWQTSWKTWWYMKKDNDKS
nr:variable surface lipoprotein [Mycoplasmopsis bovis]